MALVAVAAAAAVDLEEVAAVEAEAGAAGDADRGGTLAAAATDAGMEAGGTGPAEPEPFSLPRKM